MKQKNKQLSNPFSTGGGGFHFEAHVQASFVTLMLTGGYTPCLPCWPIKEVRVQAKIDGYNTDDLIVFVENPESRERRKLLGQVKYSISFTKKDPKMPEVIQAAWNDFNNQSKFTKDKDIIALITGSLNATDYKNVQWLLNQARHTKNAAEYYKHVTRAKFSPPKSGEKLEVLKYFLKLANNNKDISREQLYSFLNHFHLLGYDLGKEVGVVLSLLHSHISQFNQQNPQQIWSRIVDIVQTWNQDGGTITLDNLPEDLREAFRQPVVAYIPKELTRINPEQEKTDWNQSQYATDLALVNLVGSWNEKNEADISILSRMTTQNFSDFGKKIREVLQITDSPLSLQNGLWTISERADLWDIIGSHVFDQNLDSFKKSVVAVLTERDPAFELTTDERYAASFHGKVLTFSPALRKGLSEGLALLGTMSDALPNCSHNKAEEVVVLAVREIFEDADWRLWGSLNSLLPDLAESSPDEFLNAVEHALSLLPCPFDELFSQEGDGLSGGNYLTGLLWALEGLAWDKKYLVRVCVLLGELASHDPGGNWSNRPGNSLSTILLPWLPQTIAPIGKRQVAVQTLCREWPEIGWELLIKLLPNQHQMSTGSHKPSWRNFIPDGWEKGVTRQEYWNQVSFYSDLAVTLANYEPTKLVELIDNFDGLPTSAFDQLIEVLSSDVISNLPENKRLIIWDRLTIFTNKHRRYSEAKWSISDESLTPIEGIAKKLAPSDPSSLYQRLFTDNDFDLYDENENWEEQREKLVIRRHEAVERILSIGGIESVIQFAEAVESPLQVGRALGRIAMQEVDTQLLPEYLTPENNKLTFFINGYVWIRHYTDEWIWADKLDKTDWDNNQISQFLNSLPFTHETWDRAAKWLGNSEGIYWSQVNVNPYGADGNLDVAVDKLVEYGRPHAAIDCLTKIRFDKQLINVDQCVRVLLAALSSSEPAHSIDVYHIVELIKILQKKPEVNLDDLFTVEWAYLRILDGHHGATPIFLDNRLANDSEFFCEVIRLIYKSKKDDSTTKEPTEEEKAVASNAWRLLYDWRTLPGMQDDGKLNDSNLINWFQRVKETCMESGHLEVALTHIGGVLFYSPPDPDGLWINHRIADILNAKDAEEMRNGYSTELYNSRGVHWVDPTGKPEFEFAEKYRQQAEEVENAGYQRFAITLRNIEKSYIRDAERIIADHKK